MFWALQPARSITSALRKWGDATAQKHFNSGAMSLRAAGQSEGPAAVSGCDHSHSGFFCRCWERISGDSGAESMCERLHPGEDGRASVLPSSSSIDGPGGDLRTELFRT